MNKEISERVIQIIEDELEVENLTEKTNLKNDLNADSIDLLNLVILFEEEFNVEVDDQELQNIETVEDICLALEKAK